MFTYDVLKLQALMEELIMANCKEDARSWLQERKALLSDPKGFNSSFAQVPRKTGTAFLPVIVPEQQAIGQVCPGFNVGGWRIDRLCRVWLLTQLDAKDKEKYFNSIENLFRSAAMNELVALYSSLPLLAWPSLWIKRCAEGIRSNIGDVLEAIMYNNPYPAANLDEPAWNQLVLKAVFTEKNINLIYGLDRRANKELAYILSDYAHERWAANRKVPPQLWRLTGKFIDEKLFPDIEKALHDQNLTTKNAAALAIAESAYPPAKDLLKAMPTLQSAINNNNLSWEKDVLPV
ncbi:MAG: EboA domain-containing protein [Bacteroidetes bacterium]|nr:EboA domain-containing protein [Bacteroidota bacterium]